MQLASSPAFPEPLLAALPQLSEKLRQGFASKNRAWHPGKIASKFMVSLGLLAVLVLNLCPTPLLVTMPLRGHLVPVRLRLSNEPLSRR
jgi:hypothetical protein